VPSLGGYVYAITQSPIHPGRLAVGVGDCLIRVWNHDNSLNKFDVQTFWQGIKAKVTALSWHPTRENWLAYGTDDGKVGITDVLSSKMPLISNTYHQKTVYVVCWGPTSGSHVTSDDSGQYSLYSIGDGVILQHDCRNLNKPATNIDSIISQTNGAEQQTVTSTSGRTAMSWNSDWTFVAIGNEDGGIEVFEKQQLRRVCTLLVHKKLINCLSWHPARTAQSGAGLSPCNHWLATGSNNNVIHVFDLQKPLASSATVYQSVVVTESMRQLFGHNTRITGLSWSLHQDGFLATASYDKLSQVWDVRCEQQVAVYMGHTGRLLTVEWSATDPDVVFTGADDHTVFGWRVSQHPWTPGH